jgi:hypothetical protein
MDNYLRFVVNARDRNSGRRQGLFHAAALLERAGTFDTYQTAEYYDIRQWFIDNLKRPSRFAVSARANAKAVALSWFRSNSERHIAKMRDLQRLLEAHGVAVEVLRTRRPGYVLYADDFQIVAYPFAETST